MVTMTMATTRRCSAAGEDAGIEALVVLVLLLWMLLLLMMMVIIMVMTTICLARQIPSGSGALLELGMAIDELDFDLMAMLLYFTVTLALAFIVLSLCVRERR
jgi:uncharacterized membrane protein YhaH (DUF805 family)